MGVKVNYTREELVEICEQAVVPHERWHDRDSPHSQQRVGVCWALLRAGCEFKVSPPSKESGCHTDNQTIWLEVQTATFGTFDWDAEMDWETFYLPTPKRLANRAGEDWY